MPTLEELKRELGMEVDQPVPESNEMESRFDLDTGTFLMAPVGTRDDMLGLEARTQSGEQDTYGRSRVLQNNDVLTYLGSRGGIGDPVQAARGVGSAAVSIPMRTLASQFVQYGEEIRGGKTGLLDIRDFDSLMSWWLDTSPVTGGPNSLVPSFVMDKFSEWGIADKAIGLGENLLESNDRVLAELGLSMGEDEDPTLAYNFGAGVTTLAGALGLAVMTKSPATAAVVFGEIEQSDIYLELRDQGVPHEEAFRGAMLGGGANAILEGVGIGQLMKIGGTGRFTKNTLTRILATGLAGAGVEGTQEGLQSLSHDAVLSAYGVDEVGWSEVQRNAVSATFMGFIVGAPVSGASSVMLERANDTMRKDPDLRNEFIASIMRDVTESTDLEFEVERNVVAGRVQTMIASNRQTDGKLFQEMFKSFAADKDLTDVFTTDAQKDAFVQNALNSITEPRKPKTRATLEAGRARVLQAEEIRLIEELDALETQGEEFTTAFIEEFGITDTGIDIDFDDEGQIRSLAQERATEALESRRQFQTIRKRSEQAGSDLDRVIGELSDLRQADEIQGDILVKARKIEEADRDVLNAFQKGVRTQRTIDNKQRTEVQKVLKKLINSLDISDTAKKQLLGRIVNVKDDVSLAREIKTVLQRAIASKIRDTRKSLKADIKKTVKKNAPKKGQKSKLPADVGALMSNLAQLSKGTKAKVGERMAKRTHQIAVQETKSGALSVYNNIEKRYMDVLQDGNDADVFAMDDLLTDIEGVIALGKSHVVVKTGEADRLQQQHKDAVLPEGKELTPAESRIHPKRFLVKDKVNYMAQTYLSWLEGIGAADNPGLNDLINGDLEKATRLDDRSEWFKQQINDDPELSYEYLHDMQDPKKARFTDTYSIARKDGSTENVSLDLTKGQVIQFLMSVEDPMVRKSVTNRNSVMAMPEQVIENMEGFINDTDRRLMEILFEGYAQVFDRLDAVFRRLHNISLGRVDRYAPIVRKDENGAELPLFENVGEHQGFVDSFTKTRVNTQLGIKHRDVLDVAASYFTGVEHYIAYAERATVAKSILEDERVKSRIQKQVGDDAYTRGLEHIDHWFNMPAANQASNLKFLDWARKNFMFSVLGAKPQIGFKQIVSLFAFADEVPAKAFAKGVAKFMANPNKAIAILKGHTAIKHRGKHFDNELNRVIDQSRLGFFGERNKMRDFFMLPVKYGDALAIHIGGFAMYDHLVNNLGVSSQDALNKVAELAEKSQQSTLPTNMTLMQKHDSGFVRIFAMFTSSPIALVNMEMQAYSKWRRGDISRKQFAKTMFIYHIMIPSLFAWVASAFDTPEGDESLNTAALGPWTGLPILGDVLTFVSTMMVNTALDGDIPVFRDVGETIPITRQIQVFAVELDNAMDENASFEEFTEHIVGAIDVLTQHPESTVINIFEGIGEVFGGDVDRGLKHIAGYSDTIAAEE